MNSVKCMEGLVCAKHGRCSDKGQSVVSVGWVCGERWLGHRKSKSAEEAIRGCLECSPVPKISVNPASMNKFFISVRIKHN